ncbi:KICSTOR complex protein ITFG2 isoform X2 [Ictalurus furcatus]|uniref:KICSTOR complex protein ITFG2 isoform X2 n=1 Tax=Ictalurus furcatus TaxID=66913 RepID=UPI00235040B8|nr:KICSTOR complex protein ITFG2 isoform X2 [Ictalurus furcatus]
MRSLSFVQRVCLDFTGSLFPHAICLGDADNDSLNELVVGDTSGKLYIYKNDDSKPWLTRTCAGMLTCVGVGDLCNKGRNLVVAVGAEGWFHLFDIASAAARAESSSQPEGLFGDDQKPCFTQHIPANTKVMLISDIDGDGRSELVVGYTDRVVRAFRWEEPPDATDLTDGQLILLKKWLLEGQVDSLSVSPAPDGRPELMVSQPGCGYAILLCSWTQDGAAAPGETRTAASAGEGPSRDVVLRLTTSRIHNKNVSTHLIGSISRGLYACKQGRNTPCLVYVSFSHKIYVYWRVELECMEPTSLRKVLEEKPEYTDLLRKLGVDASDAEAVRELIGDVLYRDSERRERENDIRRFL